MLTSSKTEIIIASWIFDSDEYDNASLEPYIIMIWNNNIYVLDVKNYKYDTTKKHGIYLI